MSSKIYDTTAEAAIAKGPNALVSWYLMASYAYYVLDKPILSDGYYDTICFLLAEELDQVNIDHPHAVLCDMSALDAGTAYNLKPVDYPKMVVGAVETLVLADKSKIYDAVINGLKK